MVWTQEEEELIAILDNFVAKCSQSKKLKNSNYHRLLEQILAVTKGEVNATRQYCQQILSAEGVISQDEIENLTNKMNSQPQSSVKTEPKSPQNRHTRTELKPKRFQSCWTILFLLVAVLTIFFTAKRSPNLSSVNTSSNVALLCPLSLQETAQQAIANHDEMLLKKAIADFQQLKKQQANQIGTKCEQLLWETQYVYAINFLASKGQTKSAVATLCAIPPQYYQDKEIIPWFSRWSNTNLEFAQWLNQYKVQHTCPIAIYLE